VLCTTGLFGETPLGGTTTVLESKRIVERSHSSGDPDEVSPGYWAKVEAYMKDLAPQPPDADDDPDHLI
jgi:hypothetical protein